VKQYIDLHMHTLFSDGMKTPEELLDLVRSKKLKAFSVTDHDSLTGFLKVKELLSDDDPELVSGVELSVSIDNSDMHILAYFVDYENENFNEALLEFQKRRNMRSRLMVQKLNELGVNINFEDVEKLAHGDVIGRPHVAKAIFENRNVDYYEEAFQKYIGDNKPAYIPKENFTLKQAIDLIHQADGLAVLAHPGINNKEEYLDVLVGLGLDGLEAYHPCHKQSDVDRYIHMAEKHRLVVTGGSDYHGIEGRYGKIGSQNVPYSCLERIKEKIKKK